MYLAIQLSIDMSTLQEIETIKSILHGEGIDPVSISADRISAFIAEHYMQDAVIIMGKYKDYYKVFGEDADPLSEDKISLSFRAKDNSGEIQLYKADIYGNNLSPNPYWDAPYHHLPKTPTYTVKSKFLWLVKDENTGWHLSSKNDSEYEISRAEMVKNAITT